MVVTVNDQSAGYRMKPTTFAAHDACQARVGGYQLLTISDGNDGGR